MELAALAMLVAACGGPEATAPTGEPLAGPPAAGGRLIAALRGEPQTLNPVTAADNPSQLVLHGLTADLLHINRATQEIEAALADSWTVSEDGLVYRLGLRRNVRFSDGEPFDADDVLFSFRVYLDEGLAYGGRQMLMVGDRPIEPRKIDSHTVEFHFAEPAAAGLRFFDSVAILPEHVLAEPYAEGRLATIWGLGTAPEQIVGLGAFRVAEYRSGERLVLERNPHYWKTDESGRQLPYLDELVLIFVPGEDAQVLRFKAGETDVIERIDPGNFAELERTGDQAPYEMRDLGPGLGWELLVFNQNGTVENASPELRRRQGWFRQLAFRQAVSAAIDREAVVRLAYRGRATPIWSTISPGFAYWFNDRVPRPARSLERARRLLADAGFSWRPDETLRDPSGEPVRFSIISGSGNSMRTQATTLIQEDLRQLGMAVTVVPLEHRALVQRLLRSRDYDACVLGLGGGDPDPNPQLNILLSNGSLHLWNLGQARPASEWEAEIDRLMRQQLSTMDRVERKRLFDRVQEIMSEHMPIVPLVSPHTLVGAKRSLGNFRPAVMHPLTLWNVDELYWRESAE